MTREEKAKLIGDLSEKLKTTDHFYITDTSGLTVAQVSEFREMCYAKSIEYKVVKNTLIKKALENMSNDLSGLYDVLKGPSGLMFVNENASAPARVITNFKKKDALGRPKFKGACIDSDLFIGEDQLKALASLKTREELIGEVLHLLRSPVTNVLSLLQSGKHKLAGIVKTLSEKEK